MKLFITGASGFVGAALVQRLLQDGEHILKAVTRTTGNLPQGVEGIRIQELTSDIDWSEDISDIDCVIHVAGRAHIMNETVEDTLSEFRRVNVAATANLAQQAADAGVKRFVFLSTIKVNGEKTITDQSFNEGSATSPEDAYGRSKLEAERKLLAISEKTGLEVVIVRLPLVYGPGVKGNFIALLNLIRKGIPLPLGSVTNKRSMIFVENLVDFILLCVTHPKAANQVFVISDDEDLSTPELFRQLAKSMNRTPLLPSIPVSWLEFSGKVLRKPEIVQRLCSNLRVDISKGKQLLDWHPPYSVVQGLEKTVAWYCSEKGLDGKRIEKSFEFLAVVTRSCDFILALSGLLLGFPLLLLVAVVGWFDTGSPLFCQERVGQGKKPFVLIKFRTMELDTISVASHLVSASSLTRFGHFLRRTKLDELPQLWNVLKGEMSLVGPRPCLFSQEELIYEREQRGVYTVRPGITGLAQVNGIDMSTPKLLAETDARMIAELTLGKYFGYVVQTLLGKGSGDRVKGA